ncbi:MAG TPA: hypothetical protein PKI62_16280 [bacterium]|nr:hypothetical protein [bacterium]HPR88167.1 hypothetical protein [bacterium]
MSAENQTRSGDTSGAEIFPLHAALERLDARTSQQALELAEGRAVGCAGFLWRPLGRFVRAGVAEGRLLQGFSGFCIAWLAALEVMLLNMKIWHLQRHHDERASWGGRIRP